MNSSGAARLKSWLRRSRKSTTPTVSPTVDDPAKRSAEFTNPVENYYRHKIKTNLPVFYRFALQTRSLAIRDTLAKNTSSDGWGLADLLVVLENYQTGELTEPERRSMKGHFDSSVLLTLADLLANTARDDLDTDAAVKIYAFVYEVFGKAPFVEQHILQYVEALNEMELYEESERLAEEFSINELAPLQSELLQLQRTRKTSRSIDVWLATLNDLYTSLGMTNVRLLSDNSLPVIDRLTAGPTRYFEGPKVSVIMPTFEPGPGIRTALRSLTEQSWQNLEIIVVNDASPSHYNDLFDEVQRLDPRIRVLHQERNLGPYVARNSGLASATGEFITTHDDDDWSHPDKIALQVNAMIRNASVVATTSAHIRTTAELHLRRVNMHAKFMQMNYSSLMFRKSIIDEIGPWDTVNRGGDSEFYTRLIENVGGENVVNLLDRPLSFSRVWEGSLTSGEMSRGYFAYSRLMYRWAFRQWHWDVGKLNQKAIRRAHSPRPYAIPTSFEPGQNSDELGFFDVIYVTDFFRQAKYVDIVLDEIETLNEAGLRVGYMHLSSPETTRPAGFPKRLFELQLDGSVVQLSLEDNAEARILIVYDASIGMFGDQFRASVKAHRAILIDHTLPTLSGAEYRLAFHLRQSLKHLDHCFGTRFEVAGATSDDHSVLRHGAPETRVLDDEYIWHLHTRELARQIEVPTSKPVVGFHTYGNRYRWPSSSHEFLSAYVSSQFHTRFYGQLDPPREKFGDENFVDVEVVNSDLLSEAQFLQSIDFWVYMPNARLQDRLWEPVLTAMQAGKVVILPPRLANIYDDGALYAEADQVEHIVRELTQDTERYVAQAKRGQGFVASAYTGTNLVQRVKKLM